MIQIPKEKIIKIENKLKEVILSIKLINPKDVDISR